MGGTLTGTVPSVWMKQEAEKAAKRVYGVRGVADDIQLNLTTKRTDSEIARDAVDALQLLRRYKSGAPGKALGRTRTDLRTLQEAAGRASQTG